MSYYMKYDDTSTKKLASHKLTFQKNKEKTKKCKKWIKYYVNIISILHTSNSFHVKNILKMVSYLFRYSKIDFTLMI